MGQPREGSHCERGCAGSRSCRVIALGIVPPRDNYPHMRECIAMATTPLPQSLAQIRDDFLALDERNRLQLLLEFSRDLPALPERYEGHPDLFERVQECQSPVFIFVEVDDDQIVHVFATAPEEAPTTRGFASVLIHGLGGLTASQVLDVPEDYANTLGLTQAVSPLRMRGMTALFGRIKRQVRERMAA
jgi:cysteine desulfuration protein SufE